MWLTQSSFSTLKNNNNKMKNKEQHIFPFIERLLDGAEVEWKKLGEVIQLEKGKQLNKHGKHPKFAVLHFTKNPYTTGFI